MIKTKDIGIITLFQILENENNKENELNMVIDKLEHLYNEENPYDTREGYVGGKSVTWEIEHSRKIQKYEQLFKELDSKKTKGLSDKDKEEIETARKIHTLLMDDFGLKREDFIDETNIHFDIKNFETKIIPSKILAKRMPKLTIYDYIDYK